MDQVDLSVLHRLMRFLPMILPSMLQALQVMTALGRYQTPPTRHALVSINGKTLPFWFYTMILRIFPLQVISVSGQLLSET